MVACTNAARLVAVQVYEPASLRESDWKERVFVTERMAPFLDHWICGVGSPVAEQVSVCGLCSMPILSLGWGVKVGGTGIGRIKEEEEELG